MVCLVSLLDGTFATAQILVKHAPFQIITNKIVHYLTLDYCLVFIYKILTFLSGDD